jgi:GSH-dependent disulfide-bond oxidoreductase
MIELHSWPTPNGIKISIMLEECGLTYKPVPINIRNGDQFKPDFLKISPNNKIPALVDTDGPGGKTISLFESGAILIYLAEKTGKFMPTDPVRRYEALQWLMFQMAGIGPMFGQFSHFNNYAREKLTYAIERYSKESDRLVGVLDRRLAEAEYLAGDYSIADMASWAWVRGYERRKTLNDYPNVKRWFEAIAARPAVQRGSEFLAKEREEAQKTGITDKVREIYFGDTQHQRR